MIKTMLWISLLVFCFSFFSAGCGTSSALVGKKVMGGAIAAVTDPSTLQCGESDYQQISNGIQNGALGWVSLVFSNIGCAWRIYQDFNTGFHDVQANGDVKVSYSYASNARRLLIKVKTWKPEAVRRLAIVGVFTSFLKSRAGAVN